MISKYYSRLRTQLVILILSFSLIPLLVLGITIYYKFSAAYKSMVLESLRNHIENRRSALEGFFEERIAQLSTIANHHSFEKLMDEDYLNQIFSTMQARSKAYVDMGLIDSQGNHLAYVGPFYDKLKSVNYAHEPWFNSVMSTSAFISDVFMGFRQVPHFIIAVRRIEGNKTWILRATVDSEIIENMVRRVQLGKKGDAFVVNRNNLLQTAPRFSGKLLETPLAPDFASAASTLVEKIDFNGEPYLFASSPLSYPRWILVLRGDPKEEMAPLSEATYLEAIVLIAGIGLVILGTFFTTRSITNELARMEHQKSAADEAVMQAGKMAALGKMAAGVAHEINNPLQIITDQAGWMKDLLAEEDIRNSTNFQEFESCVRKIERNVERCRTITHRMLRFGRRMEPTLEEVDINATISETITFLENEARFREIEIETDFGEHLPVITVDRAQLQQVFLNVIDNALDAIGKSGHIQIRTTYNSGSPGEVVIDCTDNGPGIPKAMVSKVFDPFFSTKSANEGSGLGLSITYSIIQRLGGRISVASEEGKGTTFTIRLPAR